MYAVNMYIIGYFLTLGVLCQHKTAADYYDFIEVHSGKIAPHMLLFYVDFLLQVID